MSTKYHKNIYKRAFQYLYSKETKLSFEIEKEKPSQNKMDNFIALLNNAGLEEDFLTEYSLTQKQKKIVDSRFAANGLGIFKII